MFKIGFLFATVGVVVKSFVGTLLRDLLLPCEASWRPKAEGSKFVTSRSLDDAIVRHRLTVTVMDDLANNNVSHPDERDGNEAWGPTSDDDESEARY